MVMTLLRQMWNRRRQNGWIFLELIAVGIFLWVVLDPLCVQIANKNIDRGYEQDGLYLLNMDKYGKRSARYSREYDTDSIGLENYHDIIRVICNLPEVGSFVVNESSTFANSGSFYGGNLYGDSALTKDVDIQCYWFYPVGGSDMLKTYRFRDANTGEIMGLSPDFRSKNIVYVSESVARRLYGRTDVAGEKCWLGNRNCNEIGGVFRDFKDRDYNQPYPMMVAKMGSTIRGSKTMHWRYSIVFRVKDGVDADGFEHRFNEEVKPALVRGNYYCTGISRLGEYARNMAEMTGDLNVVRKNTIFAMFGLCCVFLGMVGTFWVQVNARRQEIGVMRSLGASKYRIMAQFIMEALILVTVTSVIAIAVMGYYVHAEGFFAKGGMQSGEMPDMQYWQNNPLPHFMIISLVMYLSLLVISIIGTCIPVGRAIRELPADALREE